MLEPIINGFLLSAGLIIAIGAQNALLLRQGLLRQHVLLVSSIFFLADALLITLGVFGVGALIAQNTTLLKVITLLGALVLFLYGCFALRRACQTQRLQANQSTNNNTKKLILNCLAFTFLNPHVYLDTVVLLGSLSSPYQGNAKLAFTLGAICASALWFYSLGFGARILTSLFANPRAWQILELLVAIIMFGFAASLILNA